MRDCNWMVCSPSLYSFFYSAVLVVVAVEFLMVIILSSPGFATEKMAVFIVLFTMAYKLDQTYTRALARSQTCQMPIFRRNRCS